MKIYTPELSNIAFEAKIGESCTIHSFAWIGTDVVIGARVKIQAFTFIPNGVTIEDDVFIGPRVTFTNDPKMNHRWEKTLVKKGAKIGAGAIINCVTIGENAIIGAGSLVLKDVPAGECWVGVPAKKKGKL